MKHSILLGLMILFSGALSAQNPEYVLIRNGDVEALRDAIENANKQPGDTKTDILLSGDFHFSAQSEMPRIDAEISISSFDAKARILGPKEDLDPANAPTELFQVNEGGKLTLHNLVIADLLLRAGEGLIQNSGELRIQHVVFSAVSGSIWCGNMGPCHQTQAIILNHSSGLLELDSVSIENSGVLSLNGVFNGGVLSNSGEAFITNTQLYLTDQNWGWTAPFYNSGKLEVNSSSFFHRPSESSYKLALFRNETDAIATVTNSIISGFYGNNCEVVTSLGHNLHSEDECNWSSDGDITGVTTGLMWRPVEARWSSANSPILTRALVPSAASAAKDSANPETCSPFHLLGGRRNLLDQECDRGAVEASSSGLGEGGINGLYYNPEADGHYIQIMQTDFLTLVIWNTFDVDGNHVWVFGTGQLVDGRSVIAETYINRNVIVLPEDPMPDTETEYWGTLEVDMNSCVNGTLAFHSVFPEFGSGQFPLTRLAYVKQLGCVD
jgi:hypothetical protein